ncbi:hypothetical protein ECN1_4905 [Escherichia coli N1]|nr:hypothetical protein ECN1_4905 [Escherichia coli N1]
MSKTITDTKKSRSGAQADSQNAFSNRTATESLTTARGDTARRSPSDRTLVSEWARKRKRIDIDLSTYA